MTTKNTSTIHSDAFFMFYTHILQQWKKMERCGRLWKTFLTSYTYTQYKYFFLPFSDTCYTHLIFPDIYQKKIKNFHIIKIHYMKLTRYTP